MSWSRDVDVIAASFDLLVVKKTHTKGMEWSKSTLVFWLQTAAPSGQKGGESVELEE